ncbi:6-pyruvoyl tetrahydrobiopterin synthase [Oopsacas minuta]|uniref:6-pyruvoyl tetrahydrobiopterin synthase n=1 Tax=Oopsacas minuta TaxID=111878 RepID=A0AAV7KI95_9METZ|nr:6-pyruvoyl tetrahydrobiopterin synthase [Oopsacas minuta]
MNGPIGYAIRTESFNAAHRLHSKQLSDEENKQVYGKCNNPNYHGHNYKWTVTLRGPVDLQTGMIYNIAELKHAMQQIMIDIDHKNLDLDVEYFYKKVSTTENLTIYLWESITQLVPRELVHEVKVEETEKNSFVFRGEYSSK